MKGIRLSQIIISLFVMTLATVSATAAQPIQWPEASGGNGHWYQPVAVPGWISWNGANAAAEAAGGHLVTMGSAEENAFVFDLIDDDPALWDDSNLNHSHGSGPWIGGLQPDGSPEPKGRWRWVTGEPWFYANWAPEQPNDDPAPPPGQQNRAQFLGYGQLMGPTWNDARDYSLQPGYVIEIGVDNVPGVIAQPPVQWKTADGGNGHRYQVVQASGGVSWFDAEAAAEAEGGHLATITSAEENAFIYDLIDEDSSLWLQTVSPRSLGPWLGGLQPDGSPEPDGNWQWVTGEPFLYLNWEASRPDDSFDYQDKLHFLGPYVSGGVPWGDEWNDLDGQDLLVSYVVEFVPEPATMSLLAFGGLALLRRRGRRRK